jgi:hypothetical protein
MHFHWPLDQILDLEHGDRRRWVLEIKRAAQAKSENARAEDSFSIVPSQQSEPWLSLPNPR